MQRTFLNFLFLSVLGTLKKCQPSFVFAGNSGLLSIMKFRTIMDENCLYEVSKGVALDKAGKLDGPLEVHEVSGEDEIFQCSSSIPFTENCGSMVDFGFTFEFKPSGSGRFTWHHISNNCPMTHLSFIFEKAISICHSDSQLVLALERMAEDGKTFDKDFLFLFTSFHNQERVAHSFDHLRNATKGNEDLQHLDPILCVDFNQTISVVLEKGIREIGDDERRLLGRSMTSGFVDVFFDGRGNMDGVSEWSNASDTIIKHEISEKIKLALISTALAVCIISAGYASSWWYQKKYRGKPQPKIDLQEPLLNLNFQNEKHESSLIDLSDSDQNQQECEFLSVKSDNQPLLKDQDQESKSCSESEDEEKNCDLEGKKCTKASDDDRKIMFPASNQNIDLL